MRFALAKKNYHNWDKFLWVDWRMRDLLTKTFNARHAPLTGADGEFAPHMQDPVEWKDEQVGDASPAPAPATAQVDASSTTAAISVTGLVDWDSENEMWVPRDDNSS
jgi:hypothetical protein